MPPSPKTSSPTWPASDHAAGDHAAGDDADSTGGAPRGRPRCTATTLTAPGGSMTTCASPGSRRGKTQAPNAPGGRFGKDRFGIDLTAGTVDCPGGVTAVIRPAADGGGMAHFGAARAGCPLRAQCTTAAGGRTITVGPYEATLAAARARQTDPDWIADYRATRPKVERKIGHLIRRGGRRARVRGTARVDADFRLASAVNLARLATLGVRSTFAGWAIA